MLRGTVLVLHFLFYHFLVLWFYNYNIFMALNSLLCADVPLRNCSLTHSVCDCLCVSVCPHSKRKTTWASKLGTRILYGSRSACIHPEVRGSRSRSYSYKNSHCCMAAVAVVILLPVWVCTLYDCLDFSFVVRPLSPYSTVCTVTFKFFC